MRFIAALLFALAVTGCDLADTASPQAVDASTLAPMTGRERSLLFAADGAVQQGNYAAAERDYLTAIAESKGHVDAHIALARLYDKQGQYEKELPILERARTLQPNEPLVNYMLGKVHLDANRFDEAHEAFQRGLKTRPDDMDLGVGEAVSNDMLGNHVAAQMGYLRVMRLNQTANLSTVRTNLAMSFLLSNEPKKAVELLKEEVKKPGVSAVTRHNMALAYGLLGRNADAKKILNGDIDEDTRQLALARLKEYLSERGNDIHTPPLKPSITPATGATSAADKPAVKSKAATAKPVPKEIVEPKPASSKTTTATKPVAPKAE
jgi:Flp pilus assembly protein TadD